MKRFCVASAILWMMFAAGCSYKPEAKGSYYSVTIFADEGNRRYIQHFVDKYIQDTILTPQKESVFRFQYVDSALFIRNLERRDIILIAPLNGRSEASRIVGRMLTNDAKQKVVDASADIFIKKDIYAVGQKIIVLTGENIDLTMNSIQRNGTFIKEMLEDGIDSLLREALVKSLTDCKSRRALEDSIKKSYGFYIPVVPGFEWEKGNPEHRFLWLRHIGPEQWLFIYYEPLSARLGSPVKSFIHLRDSLCDIYYEGDRVDSIYSVMQGVHFAAGNAIRVRGLWMNPNTILGGPFFTYIYDDSLSGRRFYIDCAVFLPGRRKEPYLRQVIAVAKGFRLDTTE